MPGTRLTAGDSIWSLHGCIPEQRNSHSHVYQALWHGMCDVPWEHRTRAPNSTCWGQGRQDVPAKI